MNVACIARSMRTLGIVVVDKYSIGLYFKSWLLDDDHEHDCEHVRVLFPTNVKGRSGSREEAVSRRVFLDLYSAQAWYTIRCDVREILANPHHHLNHERFVGVAFVVVRCHCIACLVCLYGTVESDTVAT